MKIVHLSNSNFPGAYSAAFKIHKICQESGHDSTFYCKYSSNNNNIDSSTFVQSSFLTLFNFLKLKMRTLLAFSLKIKSEKSKYSFYQFKESFEGGINNEIVNKIDSAEVLFVHWVTNFVNFYDIKKIQDRTNCKVIFTLMDMAHLTGGCHYSNSCNNFKKNCNKCPALNYSSFLPEKQLNSKRQVSLSLNAEIISFSSQNYIDAKESKVFFKKIHKLSLPSNSDIFKTISVFQNKDVKYFNILGSAFTLLNKRKGPDYFFKTLVLLDNLLDNKQIKLRVFHIDLDFESKHNFKNIIFEKFTFLSNQIKLSELYNKMDLIIFTSIADAAPQMIAEALMCGTPVISFNVGNSKSIIENGIDGYVVKMFDVKSLSHKAYLSLFSTPSNWASRNQRSKRAALIHSEIVFKKKFNLIINDLIC